MAKQKEEKVQAVEQEVKTITNEDKPLLDWDLIANKTDNGDLEIGGEIMSRKGRLLVTGGALMLIANCMAKAFVSKGLEADDEE